MKISSDQTPKPLNPALRWTLFISGFIAIGLGIIGIFLPLLPTVPFLLLALACFGRSSERFYGWLLNHTHLGPLIRPFLQGRGMTRAIKIRAIGLLWISIAFSALFLINVFWVQGVLLVTGLGVTLYLLSLPTAEKDNQDDVS
jgi:hypothetical protein